MPTETTAPHWERRAALWRAGLGPDPGAPPPGLDWPPAEQVADMRLTIGALQKENGELKAALQEIRAIANLMVGAENAG